MHHTVSELAKINSFIQEAGGLSYAKGLPAEVNLEPGHRLFVTIGQGQREMKPEIKLWVSDNCDSAAFLQEVSSELPEGYKVVDIWKISEEKALKILEPSQAHA